MGKLCHTCWWLHPDKWWHNWNLQRSWATLHSLSRNHQSHLRHSAKWDYFLWKSKKEAFVVIKSWPWENSWERSKKYWVQIKMWKLNNKKSKRSSKWILPGYQQCQANISIHKLTQSKRKQRNTLINIQKHEWTAQDREFCTYTSIWIQKQMGISVHVPSPWTTW